MRACPAHSSGISREISKLPFSINSLLSSIVLVIAHRRNPSFRRGRLDLLDSLHRKPIQRELDHRAQQRQQQQQQQSSFFVNGYPVATAAMAPPRPAPSHHLPSQLPPMSLSMPVPTPTMTATSSSDLPSAAPATMMSGYGLQPASSYEYHLGPPPQAAAVAVVSSTDGHNNALELENDELRRENEELRARCRYLEACMSGQQQSFNWNAVQTWQQQQQQGTDGV